MSGGSQHNPNGRQAQIGAGWSPLQLQVANFLARAPQAHMAERGVTWHTPTPPPHLYVPAPSPPDSLQAMKTAGNSVFRHTATPPDMYRHPADTEKHLLRHTPSPSDVKTPPIPPAELYPHLGPARDKLVRPEELLYGRGVDLSVGSARNGNPSPAPPAHPAHPSHPSPALSVRDAPTINSLIARAQPRAGHARVDALLERLAAPGSPHSVIVHPRAHPHTPTSTSTPSTPSPPSSNEDSADSCGAPPGSKRKRKPERTVRMPSIPPPIPLSVTATESSPLTISPRTELVIENGESHHNGRDTTSKDKPTNPNLPETLPEKPPTPPPSEPQPHTRRKTRSNSAETIDDIAAMIASDPPVEAPSKPPEAEPEAAVSIDKLKSVLASPDSKNDKVEEAKQSSNADEKEKEKPAETIVEAAAAPKRRSARTSNAEATNVPVESPSEAIPAEPEASEARSAEPTAASFVEVENQLEKMFAGLEETPKESQESQEPKPKKRRKSAPTKGETKAGRRAVRGASTGDSRRKGGKKKGAGKAKKSKEAVKDAYDSGSNASSSRSRGPYIQIRGPRDSPRSVNVINASTGEDEGEGPAGRRKRPDDFRNGLRVRGLHASTLGLRYDATTPDATWLCAFCERGPHYAGLGDLFGPYTADTDCTEYRMLDETALGRYAALPSPSEVWFHAACGVWAPGLVAAGARLWGLAAAVWGARGATCGRCGGRGAGLACRRRHCPARTHYPCAIPAGWKLDEEEFRATCPAHTEEPA